MNAEEVRAYADSVTPRTKPDGSINTQHVAIEQTLRTRHGLPSYIAELDGPGRFRPVDLLGEDTKPFREVILPDGSAWLVMQREVSGTPQLEGADALTITHQLVRAGGPHDPRTTDPKGA